MKSEIVKEIRYAMRSGRVLILLVSFLFFALLTPVMLKTVLPMVLSSQFTADTSPAAGGIMDMTQLDCIQNYMGDVFEIGTIIIAFTLCGLTASEIRGNTWVLSLCAGKQFAKMILAKFLVFGALVVIVSILALLADYVYSGFLFSFQIGIFPILYSGLLQGIYMLFLLSCLIMWGVLMKKPIPAGFCTLSTAFGLHFISSLLHFHEWTPSGLISHATELSPAFDSSLLIPLGMTILLVISMIVIALARLKRMEWSTRNT